MSTVECPAHGITCTPGDCPDYMPRWLRGACSSGDPLRRAVVLVVDELERRRVDNADLREERDSLNEALRDTAGMAQDAERAAYDSWCAMQEHGR